MPCICCAYAIFEEHVNVIRMQGTKNSKKVSAARAPKARVSYAASATCMVNPALELISYRAFPLTAFENNHGNLAR